MLLSGSIACEYLQVTTNDWQQRYHPLILQKTAHHHVVDKCEIAGMHLINLRPKVHCSPIKQ